MVIRKLRMFTIVLAAALLATLLFVKMNQVAASEDDDALKIVADGQARAVVVIDTDASEKMVEAANMLAAYVEESTGAKLPVKTVDALDESYEGTEIYIGENDANEDAHIGQALENLDEDGFFIHPHDNRLTIIGPTELGTQNGVYEFLKRFVGVRWLAPGDDWEHVPHQDDIALANEDVREEPDFSVRTINMNDSSNEQKEARKQWQLRHQFQYPWRSSGLQIGHNMHSLFSVDKFGESNPEFYPGGKPPAKGETTGWQPCYTEEGIVDAAVQEIKDYFRDNPDEDSYSLAINDSKGHCEDDPSHPDYPDKKNSMGLTDLSDIYYTWVNDVVEQVREDYPDKYFGLYAYDNVMDPPSFEIDDHVVPYITRDRMAWVDEGEREKDHHRLEEWSKVASHIGWYEGFYGTSYFLPRVYSHQLADNLRFGKENNVTDLHADSDIILGDFPRAWLLAQLLWDVDMDENVLLDEWYEAAVGPEAAPDLKEYYDFWEDFWTNRILESEWFEKTKSGRYLGRTDSSYLTFITEEEMEQSRDLLELVVDKAETEEQKVRAEQMLHQFEFYEVSFQLANSNTEEIDRPTNEEMAFELLEDIGEDAGTHHRLLQRRKDLHEEYKENVSLMYPFPYNSNRVRGNFEDNAWNQDRFWYLVDYVKEYEPSGGAVTDALKELAYTDEDQAIRFYASVILDIVDQGTDRSLTKNPSFEDGNSDATDWDFWNPNGSANIVRVEDVSSTGNASVLFENTERGGVYQTLPIQPGLMTSRVSYYTPEDATSEGTIQIVIEAHNGSGGKEVYRSKANVLSETAGEWTEVNFRADLPETIDGERVETILVNSQINDAEDAQVYQDDLVVYQYEASIADLDASLEQLGEMGEFENEKALRTLQAHVASLRHYEKAGKTTKFFKHMQGLQQLLEYDKENEWISDKAYDILTSQYESISGHMFSASLDTSQIHATKPGDYPVTLTLENNTSQPIELELEGQFPDNMILDSDGPISLDAESSIEIEATVRISEDVSEGDHETAILGKVEGGKLFELPLHIHFTKNLIPNPGFEESLSKANWYTHTLSTVERIQDDVKSGEYAVTLSPREGSDNRLGISTFNVIPVAPGSTYEVSFWAKSTLTNRDRLGVGIQMLDTEDNDGNNVKEIWEQVTDSEWTKYTVTFTPTDETRGVKLFLRGAPSPEGQIWFDDVRLEEIKTGSLILNPGFENSLSKANWYTHTQSTVQRVQDDVKSGEYAVTLSPREGSEKALGISTYEVIPVSPGKTYEISFWAKSNLTNRESLGLGIQLLDAENNDGNIVKETWEHVTDSDWTNYTVTFEPTAETRGVKIFLRGAPSPEGQIWFDDVWLGKVD